MDDLFDKSFFRVLFVVEAWFLGGAGAVFLSRQYLGVAPALAVGAVWLCSMYWMKKYCDHAFDRERMLKNAEEALEKGEVYDPRKSDRG